MGDIITSSEKVENLESTTILEIQHKIFNQILNPDCNSKFYSSFLIITGNRNNGNRQQIIKYKVNSQPEKFFFSIVIRLFHDQNIN